MFEAIGRMTGEIARIAGGQLYGAWLYGSAATGDFRPGWSDIDIAALTGAALTESQTGELLFLRQRMLEEEPGNPFYRAFEGIIASLDEYRTGAFTRLVYWGTSGQRITDSYTPDAFSRFELARYGKALYGDRPWPFPPPEREELVTAVRKHYDSIRKHAVTTDDSLYSCGWLLDIARCAYGTGFASGRTAAAQPFVLPAFAGSIDSTQPPSSSTAPAAIAHPTAATKRSNLFFMRAVYHNSIIRARLHKRLPTATRRNRHAERNGCCRSRSSGRRPERPSVSDRLEGKLSRSCSAAPPRAT